MECISFTFYITVIRSEQIQCSCMYCALASTKFKVSWRHIFSFGNSVASVKSLPQAGKFWVFLLFKRPRSKLAIEVNFKNSFWSDENIAILNDEHQLYLVWYSICYIFKTDLLEPLTITSQLPSNCTHIARRRRNFWDFLPLGGLEANWQ